MAPFFILFILLISPHLQVNSQNLSTEQTILLSLKQHWSNPLSLSSWTSNTSPCTWPQVECNSGDSVIRLNLAKENISGTIPSYICQLQNLVSIFMSDNNISGDIPASLHNCSNLQELDLSLNMLSGTIPGEIFLIRSLRHLSLNGNRLYGEIPATIEADSLVTFDLSDNHLNGSIPENIGNLNNLTWFNLSMNSFSSAIPMGLFNMQHLEYLSLGYNKLSGQLPAQLNLPRLQILNLTHNRLNGTIPKKLGELAELRSVDLSDNELSADIVEIVLHLAPRNRIVLKLCSNKFFRKIPRELVNREFDENCFDFSNLCSENRTKSLPNCPSSLCSEYRFRRYLKCKPKDDTFKIFIFILGVGCGVVGFAILYYLARKCWLKKHEINAEEQWKIISFQKLKFNKTEIVTSLTDENLIGYGGSGKVYRVFTDRTAVAVKSISNSEKSDHRLEKEFLAEIQTLGNIRHYNIVKLLCCITDNNMKLLVYQYFENKSLDQWLHGSKREKTSSVDNNNSVTKLNWPMRLHIAVGAAQGLSYMHHDCSPPIVHRDIKSSNILLDSEFNAKIADFGLAKLLNKQGDTEIASAVAGTFGYIAPEYAYTSKLNTKSDVYSFGVVLLELTTGRKAVTQGDHTNLAGWAQLQYRDTSAIFDALDGEIKEAIYLDQIIAVFRLGVVCTATSPSNRPSMKDCLHILQNCSNNLSSLSPMNSQLSDHVS